MNSFMKIFSLAGLLVVLAISGSDAGIPCIRCTSFNDRDCENYNSDGFKTITSCPDHLNVCLVGFGIKDGRKFVYRDCAHSMPGHGDACIYTADQVTLDSGEFDKCSVCSGTNCNSESDPAYFERTYGPANGVYEPKVPYGQDY